MSIRCAILVGIALVSSTGRGVAPQGSADLRCLSGPVDNPDPHVPAESDVEGWRIRHFHEDIQRAEKAFSQAGLYATIRYFTLAEANGTLDYDHLLILGTAYYLLGRLDSSEQVWRRARVLNPNRVEAEIRLADVARRRGMVKEERTVLENVFARAPKDCRIRSRLALILAANGDSRKYRKLLAGHDGCSGAHPLWRFGSFVWPMPSKQVPPVFGLSRVVLMSHEGNTDAALRELEETLAHASDWSRLTEIEMLADLQLDPAFAQLRQDERWNPMMVKYLPRAHGWKDKPCLQDEQMHSD